MKAINREEKTAPSLAEEQRANVSEAAAQSVPKVLRGKSFIQVGRQGAEQPIFAQITLAHLDVFRVPVGQFEVLYDGWLATLQLVDEGVEGASIRDQGEALHAVMRLCTDTITAATCARWIPMMHAIAAETCFEDEVGNE